MIDSCGTYFAILSLVVWTSIMPLGAHAADLCTGVLNLKTQAPILWNKIWKQAEPILIRADNGSLHEARLSFDSELPPADIVRAMQMDPDEALKFKESGLIPSYSYSELAEIFNLKSREQFYGWVLRSGANRKSRSYSLFDLNPSYAGRLLGPSSILKHPVSTSRF